MSQPLVLPEMVTSMLASFAPVFAQPSFQTFCHYLGALMLGEGRRTGTAIARATAEAKSSGVYARFCSRARWSADALLHRLGALLLSALPWPRDDEGRLILWAAIDDSVSTAGTSAAAHRTGMAIGEVNGTMDSVIAIVPSGSFRIPIISTDGSTRSITTKLAAWRASASLLVMAPTAANMAA